MSYESTVSFSGNKSFSTLSGQVRLEEGRGRLVVYDNNAVNPLTVVDNEGVHTYDGNTGKENTRLGRLPDGVYGLTTAKTGYGLDDIYGTV
jgi:hypothetical protein